MKALLKYDLSNEDDRYAYRCASRATDVVYVLVEFDSWLRNEIKYGQGVDLQCARTELWDLITSKNLQEVVE